MARDMPARWDMYAYRGDTFTEIFDVFQSDGTTAYDFTNKVVRIDLKDYPGDIASDVILILDSDSNGGIDITSNQVTVTLTPANFTNTLTKTLYNYDMQITDSVTGVITTWLKGKLYITEDISD